MIVCIPMGGVGKRFKEAGYGVYKSFLPMGDGQAMIKHVLACYPKQAKYILAIRKEYLESLAEAIPDFVARIHVIEERTPGPLQTLLWNTPTLEALDIDEPLLIADSDSLISPSELLRVLDTFALAGADGGVTTRYCVDEQVSYARVDKGGWVEECREGDPFTTTSTTGPYWFRRGSDFVRVGLRAIAEGHRSISPVYNYLIGEGKRVMAINVGTFRHLGTPEAYEEAIDQIVGKS